MPGERESGKGGAEREDENENERKENERETCLNLLVTGVMLTIELTWA